MHNNLLDNIGPYGYRKINKNVMSYVRKIVNQVIVASVWSHLWDELENHAFEYINSICGAEFAATYTETVGSVIARFRYTKN